ncbi:hypothetical protein PLICRDRAFT_29438 [Plicaturopsis crispa FD-325 SS-3]|nr:hypothetical protein PLICRDRAFT_29438 [Plicaturopsis crispa FD-325 SS-3]
MAFQDLLFTDDLTILLGLIGVTVFLLNNLYKPQPLVHPILLGRQSDVARVRNPGESAVYRNYGTGMMGRFPLRPSKEIHLLGDFLRPEHDSPRTLWTTKITNAALKERVSALGTGLIRAAGLVPHESNVLLLLNDGIEFVISDLALAANHIPSFTISSPALLSPVLDSHPPSAIITHAQFLPQVLELIYDSNESAHHTVIVVGEPDAKHVGKMGGAVKVLKWADIESTGKNTEPVVSAAPNPDDVYTVSFFESESGQLQGTQLTHANLTAGVAATRALVPLSNAISSLDTIVSAHSLSTAFGRAVAYTALYEGTSFATTNTTKIFRVYEDKPASDLADVLSASAYPIPSPTILFLNPQQLESVASAIFREAQKSILSYTFAWRHKIAGIAEGFITKESLWDRLVFDGARAKVLGEGGNALRGVIVSGGPIEATSLTPARAVLSVPFVNAHIHPLVSGPVFASHPLDLQSFPASAEDDLAPVGPPSVNLEAKLVGVQDDAIEGGADPVGVLLVKGPPVGKVLNVTDDADESVSDESDGWVGTGERTTVFANGAFKILSSRK